MRMEESAAPLLKVSRDLFGRDLDDVVRGVRLGLVVVGAVAVVVMHVAGIGHLRGTVELDGHRWDEGAK